MDEIEKSVKMLKKDHYFAPLIKRHGSPDLARYHGKMGIFPSLLRSIIYQQLSGASAGAIHRRVVALFPRNKPTPELLLKLRAPALRKAGLSIQKIAYVRDLAAKYKDGTINEKRFKNMSSQEIIDHLVAVKGIGEWTAQMLLIFTLQRPDILPVGDLAIRRGFQIVYKLKKEPNKKQMLKLSEPWRGHETAASWYLWRASEEIKQGKV